MNMSMLTRKDLDDPKLVNELVQLITTEVKGRCLVDEPLAKHTSFRTGGPARLYVYPDRVEDVSTLIKLCGEKGLRTFVIGYGTNLLVSDDADAFKSVANQLGLEHQICKGHVSIDIEVACNGMRAAVPVATA